MPSQQPRFADNISSAPCRSLPEATLRRVASEALLRVARTPAPRLPDPAAPAAGEVTELCTALLNPAADAAQAAIESFLDRGRSKSAVLLGHLPEAARRLGEMWEHDEVSFVQVGQAVGRLQRLMRTLRACGATQHSHVNRRALFATLPGETHTLGVIIAADACRERGWSVDLSLGETRETLLGEMADGGHPLLGLSVGSTRSFSALAELLPDLRATAPETPILLAGPFVATSPWRARSLAVDGWATDVPGALSEMSRLTGSSD